ncbi:MAG TPA: hypothetical protein VFL12_10855 [Thermoanaerobaculia bacterium]|nr:hypothetical protein [Thermoanaerobaculia bacterium]
MSFPSRSLAVALWTAFSASFAAAQTSSYSSFAADAPPRKGSSAVWAIANYVNPQESQAGNTAGFDGGFEYYFCRHVSGGVALGFWRASFAGDHVNEAYIDGEAAHHFVAGSHLDPYVQGGIGAYRTNLGSFGSSGTTRLGGFFGGGCAFLLSRAFAFDAAARYHVAHAAEGVHGNFWEAGGGLRFYF